MQELNEVAQAHHDYQLYTSRHEIAERLRELGEKAFHDEGHTTETLKTYLLALNDSYIKLTGVQELLYGKEIIKTLTARVLDEKALRGTLDVSERPF